MRRALLEKGGLEDASYRKPSTVALETVVEESDAAKKFAVIRQSSFDQATQYVAKKTGCSHLNTAKCFILTLVLLIGAFAWLAGPEIILTLLRTGDLPDSWPICDGNQSFIFCECAPGFSATGAKWNDLLFGTHCKPCAANELKAGRGNHACASCPVNAASKLGSETCSVCEAGYVRGAGDLACRKCPRNSYRESATSAVCRSCGAYAFTNGAANQPRDCICMKGGFRNSTKLDALCVQCPVRTYKNFTGDGQCKHVRDGYKTTLARDSEIPLSIIDKVVIVYPYKADAGVLGNFLTWIKRFFYTGFLFADDAGNQLVEVVSYFTFDFFEFLMDWYWFFFGGLHEFAREYEASGGLGNAEDWEEADKEEGQYNKKGTECPFSDAAAVTEFLKKSQLYIQLVRTSCKSNAKPLVKELSLAFHPDRFRQYYRACDSDLSNGAFSEFREVYDGKKNC